MMFTLLGRIELAMYLPNMWELKVVSIKEPIWGPKPIVTNLLGPNLVGDQQAQTLSIVYVGGDWRLDYL